MKAQEKVDEQSKLIFVMKYLALIIWVIIFGQLLFMLIVVQDFYARLAAIGMSVVWCWLTFKLKG